MSRYLNSLADFLPDETLNVFTVVSEMYYLLRKF